MNFSPQWSGYTSPYQDYFEFAFAAADLAASWWQPLLKGVGRSQLELAGMQSRNAQALLHWGRAVAGSRSPADVITANLGLCQSIAGNISEAIPKVSGALSDAARPPPAFELLPMPAKRVRDALVIPGSSDDAQDSAEQRRVA